MNRGMAFFMGLAFELVALVVGLVYVGSLLDKEYSLSGFGVAGGAVLALVVWIFHLTRAMKVLEESSDSDN
ncbi:MAG: hypothetical protein AB8E15_03395 [Bdellovibrionales bacterium]